MQLFPRDLVDHFIHHTNPSSLVWGKVFFRCESSWNVQTLGNILTASAGIVDPCPDTVLVTKASTNILTAAPIFTGTLLCKTGLSYRITWSLTVAAFVQMFLKGLGKAGTNFSSPLVYGSWSACPSMVSQAESMCDPLFIVAICDCGCVKEMISQRWDFSVVIKRLVCLQQNIKG